MPPGRPIAGVQLVDRLDAPRAVRLRVRVVLATITGELTLTQACTQLGVRRTRFHALRRQILHAALEAASGRPRGRPVAPRPAAPSVRVLTARIRELELALRTAVLRSEIALTMPFLLDRAGRKKKGAGRRASAAPARGAGGARRAEAAR